jgi:histidyl-tRNA synthetase
MELIVMPESKREGYYIGAMDAEAVDLVVKLTQSKRQSKKVACDYKAKNLKNHLKGADKANARFCCVIGSDELENGTIWIKDLQNKSEETINLKDF